MRRDLEDLVRIESVWANPGPRDEVQRSARVVGICCQKRVLARYSSSARAGRAAVAEALMLADRG